MANVGDNPEQLAESNTTSSPPDCSQALASELDDRVDDQNPAKSGDEATNANSDDRVETTAFDPNDPARPLREEAQQALLTGTAEIVQNPNTANLHTVSLEQTAAAQARAAEVAATTSTESSWWDTLREGWNAVKTVASTVVEAVVPESFYNWFNNDDAWKFTDTNETVASNDDQEPADDAWMYDLGYSDDMTDEQFNQWVDEMFGEGGSDEHSTTSTSQEDSSVFDEYLSWMGDLNFDDLLEQGQNFESDLAAGEGDDWSTGGSSSSSGASTLMSRNGNSIQKLPDGSIVYRQEDGSETAFENKGDGTFSLERDGRTFTYDSRTEQMNIKGDHCDRTVDVSGRIPDGAEKKGSLDYAGGSIDVYRTREGDNLLVRDGRVIGREREGRYEFTSGDSTFREVKLSQDANGRYQLDSFQQFREVNGQPRLVRSKDGPITTQYSFDAQGKPVEPPQRVAIVTSPEEMDALRNKVTDGNPLRVLLGDPDHPESARRFLLQNHGDGVASTTEFVRVDGQMQPRTVLHAGGQDYLWNAASQQLGVRSPDGEIRGLSAEELQTLGRSSDELRDLVRLLHRRNQTGEAVGGTAFRWPTDRDQLEIIQHSTEDRDGDGQPDTVGTTTVGPTPEAGFVVADNSGRTTTTIRPDGAIAARDNGVESWTFDPTAGFDSTDFRITDAGLTHKPSGVTLDEEGNVKNPDGSYWVDAEGNTYEQGEHFGLLLEEDDSCSIGEMAAERAEIAAKKGTMMALGAAAVSLSLSGNPWAATALAAAARNVINSVSCEHAVNHNEIEFAKSFANSIDNLVGRGVHVATNANSVSPALSSTYTRAELMESAMFGGGMLSGPTELALTFAQDRNLITDPNQRREAAAAA